MRRRRIGLLGGSFNPAHAGHLHISRLALNRLGLDELWWLVSPQNPLKAEKGMAPFAARLARAREIARDRRIKVSDIEARLGTRFTIDTIEALQRRFPRVDFVWVAGADILVQLPRWRRWTELMARIPLAVFDRPSYSLRALAGKVAHRYARRRLPATAGRRLAGAAPPAWIFVPSPRHPASATELRRRLVDLLASRGKTGRSERS